MEKTEKKEVQEKKQEQITRTHLELLKNKADKYDKLQDEVGVVDDDLVVPVMQEVKKVGGETQIVEKDTFACSNCNSDVEENQEKCSVCGADLEW